MAESRRTVLLVDDELPFLRGTARWLEANTDLAILTARDGSEAVKLLGDQRVDLVITDLQMPIMDGFELLAHMSREHEDVPVMAITAHASEECEEQTRKMGTVTCLEKPLDLEHFGAEVQRVLESGAEGFLQGISITSILQLLEMERKSARLTIERGDETARLELVDGRLVHAEVGDLRGDDAAMEVIAWEQACIDILPVRRGREETVEGRLHFLIMESLRRKDEGIEATGEGPVVDAGAEDPFLDAADLDLASEDLGGGPDADPELPPIDVAILARLEGLVDPLLEVDGVIAAAILDVGGELLASATGPEDVGAPLAAAPSLDQLASAADEACSALGLSECTEISIGARGGLFIVAVLRKASRPLRIVASLRWGGDHAALSERLGEVTSAAKRAFSSAPPSEE